MQSLYYTQQGQIDDPDSLPCEYYQREVATDLVANRQKDQIGINRPWKSSQNLLAVLVVVSSNSQLLPHCSVAASLSTSFVRQYNPYDQFNILSILLIWNKYYIYSLILDLIDLFKIWHIIIIICQIS